MLAEMLDAKASAPCLDQPAHSLRSLHPFKQDACVLPQTRKDILMQVFSFTAGRSTRLRWLSCQGSFFGRVRKHSPVSRVSWLADDAQARALADAAEGQRLTGEIERVLTKTLENQELLIAIKQVSASARARHRTRLHAPALFLPRTHMPGGAANAPFLARREREAR
eukprot:5629393-Pleurochrysis_carterae.AAC.2